MNHSIQPSLLFFYGVFLMLCGITSVIFIGIKAKTALASGGISGILAMTIGHFSQSYPGPSLYAGIVLSFGLFIVFSWRSTKTLFKIFDMITATSPAPELKEKGIAFLIISLMAVVSMVVLLIQLISF